MVPYAECSESGFVPFGIILTSDFALYVYKQLFVTYISMCTINSLKINELFLFGYLLMKNFVLS